MVYSNVIVWGSKTTLWHICYAFLKLGPSLNEHHLQYFGRYCHQVHYFPCTFMCLFNVILCLILGLLSIFSNALCRVMFIFLFATNTILVVTLLAISMRLYARGKLYLFSNLVLCNPLVFFLVTSYNLLCTIVICQFILLIVCFCPYVFRIEYFSFNSSSIFQFEFLMQWHFLSSYCYTTMKFILMFAFFFILDGYFPCCRKARSYHLGF